MEGCECHAGYVLDESKPSSPQCIEVSECGCSDDDGNYHPRKFPNLILNFIHLLIGLEFFMQFSEKSLNALTLSCTEEK